MTLWEFFSSFFQKKPEPTAPIAKEQMVPPVNTMPTADPPLKEVAFAAIAGGHSFIIQETRGLGKNALVTVEPSDENGWYLLQLIANAAEAKFNCSLALQDGKLVVNYGEDFTTFPGVRGGPSPGPLSFERLRVVITAFIEKNPQLTGEHLTNVRKLQEHIRSEVTEETIQTAKDREANPILKEVVRLLRENDIEVSELFELKIQQAISKGLDNRSR